MYESARALLNWNTAFLELNENIEIRLHNTGNGGWIIKYYLKRKYVAQFNIIEAGFEMMCRFNAKASADMFAIENQITGNGKIAWERRYPCSEGFW